MALATPEIAYESPPSQVDRARLLWPTTLRPSGKYPVLRALHPEQCRACRCDVGSLVGSPRRATGLDTLGAHLSHTLFLVPLGAAVPEAYGRRAVEVRFLHGPPLWDVATLSLTLTLTLTL
jgi:hypothetical protein